MELLLAIPLSLFLTLLAGIIIGIKLAYPHHRIIALIIYLASWIPLLAGALQYKDAVAAQPYTVIHLDSNIWWFAIAAIAILGIGYLLWTLLPSDKSIIRKVNDVQLFSYIHNDVQNILFINDTLNTLSEHFSKHYTKGTSLNDLSQDEKDKLIIAWTRCYENIFALDLLKKRYSGSVMMNPLRHERQINTFLVAYSASVIQYVYSLKIVNALHQYSYLADYLNEEHANTGIGANSVIRIKKQISSARRLLKLNTGRAFLHTIKGSFEVDNPLLILTTSLVKEAGKFRESQLKLIADAPFTKLERNIFKAWFPIQKQILIQLSYIKPPRSYRIKPNKLAKYRHLLQPGDILLERREWHATTFSIPGFWTHTALYTGSLNTMADYFDAEIVKELQQDNSAVFGRMQQTDSENFIPEVVESLRHGVIMKSLEDSARCDSLAVLRPRVTDERRRAAILWALSKYGMPYDFNLSFVNDVGYFCAELVSKAYGTTETFSVQPYQMNGRLLYSSNDFAKKFDEELDTPEQQMDLILFLDGNQRTKKVRHKDETEFKRTWKRPKWHMVRDYMGDK